MVPAAVVEQPHAGALAELQAAVRFASHGTFGEVLQIQRHIP